MIAALFVETNGCYYGLPDVDPWDKTRDARNYAGPYAVVAHPPCARWCRLAGLVEARWGPQARRGWRLLRVGAGVGSQMGGVLEHPAWSDAFAAHGVPAPAGAWQRTMDGGWVCHVEQWHYGHEAKKATWLYAFGVTPPPMIWGRTPDTAAPAYVTDGRGDAKRRSRPALVERWSSRPRALVSWCGNHVKDGEDRKRLGKKAAAATPIAFRDVLLGIARSANAKRGAA